MGGGRILGADAAKRAAIDADRHHRPGDKRRRAGGSRHQRRHRRHGDAHARRAGRRDALRHRSPLRPGPRRERHLRLRDLFPPAGIRRDGRGRKPLSLRSSTSSSTGSRVDADRNLLECTPRDWGTGIVIHAKEQRDPDRTGIYKNSVEHKYSYNAVQYKVPAFGWSSTKEHVGVWFINPTIEYLSGGASKQELVCHFDDNNNPDPIILDYWRGTHYGGGASCNIAAGENWSKVIGPIFVYCNALSKPETPSQGRPRSRWQPPRAIRPFRRHGKTNATALVAGCTRARPKPKKPVGRTTGSTASTIRTKTERGTVTGQLVLDDPQAPRGRLPNLTSAWPTPITPAECGRAAAGGFGGGELEPGRLGARREVLSVLERRHRRRAIHDYERPPR